MAASCAAFPSAATAVPAAPTGMFGHDTNASASATNPTTLTAASPHLSWVNNGGANATGQRTQVMTTPTTGVVGLWHMDGDGTDASGNGNTLLLSAAPKFATWAPGQTNFGQALQLDGWDDEARIPWSASLNVSTLTMEAWIYKDDVDVQAPILEYDNGTTYGPHLWSYGDGEDLYGNLTDTTGASHYVGAANVLTANNWHHVAITYDGTTIRLYADGVLVDSNQDGAFTPRTQTGYDLWVGKRPSAPQREFRGMIDDVRVSNVARSSAEIAAEYAARMPHATTMWDSDPTDAGAPFAACATATRCADITYGSTGSAGLPLRHGGRYWARTKYLVGGTWSSWSTWDWFQRRTPTAPTALFSGTTSAAAGSANATVSADFPRFSWINNMGSAADRQRMQVLVDPLTNVNALWNWDSRVTGWDDSGRGNMMARYNGATITEATSSLGQALSLDGVNDYAMAPWNASISLGSQLTVEAWIRKDDTSQSTPILEYHNGTTFGVHMWNYPTGSDLSVNFIDTTGAGHSVATTGVIAADTWYHVAATYDGNVGRLYLNGVQVAATTFGAFTPQTGSGYDFYAGLRPGSANHFKGNIDDIRLSNVARSAADILGYYRNGGEHNAVAWDSDPASDAGTAASCASGTRCDDWTFAQGGDGWPSLRQGGARYYVRAATGDANGWSAWSAMDWFQTATRAAAPTTPFEHSTNAAAGTANGVVTSDTPHFSAVNAGGGPVIEQRTRVLTTSPAGTAAIWHLDGSGYESGAKRNITRGFNTEQPQYVPSQPGFGEALQFDGVDDYAVARWRPAFEATSQLTLEAWIYRDDLSSTVPIIEYNNGTTYGAQLWNWPAPADVHFMVTGTLGLNVTGVITAGAWHHVAGTYDGNVARVYVDGALVGSSTIGAVAPLTSDGYDVYLADRIAGPSDVGKFFKGRIDEVRISTVARSGADILGYYRARQPHFKVMWDSGPDDTGTPIASCANATRCADSVFGSSGTSTPLAYNGARYWTETKYRLATGDWTGWSTPDWFETANTAPTVSLQSPAAAATVSTLPTLTARHTDPDVGDTGTISFQVCPDAACATVSRSGTSAAGLATGTDGTWTVGTPLTAGTWYWRAQSTDERGGQSAWSATRSMVVTSSLTLTLDAGSVDLGVATVNGSDFATSRITVDTDAANGFALVASDSSNSAGLTHTNTVNTIPDWTGTPATPTTWPATTYGYFGLSVLAGTGGKDTARWGTGTLMNDVVNLKYVGLQQGTPTTLYSRATYSAAPSVVDTAYRVSVTPSQLSGAYSTTITYTATANP